MVDIQIPEIDALQEKLTNLEARIVAIESEQKKNLIGGSAWTRYVADQKLLAEKLARLEEYEAQRLIIDFDGGATQ